MNEEIIPTRYAKALFMAAREKGFIERVRKDLDRFLHILGKEAVLKKTLAHPAVNIKIKYGLIDRISKIEKFSLTTKNFLKVLFRKRRLGFLEEIFGIFRDLILAKGKIAWVRVESVHPLTTRVKASLKEKLKKIFKKEVELIEEVNPGLIGGLRVRFGDRVYDGSVKRKLELIREALG